MTSNLKISRFISYCFLGLLFIFIISCFDITERAKHKNLFPIQKGNKWGYADSNANIIFNCEYLFADSFSDGIALVKKKDFFGVSTSYIDETGERITDWFEKGGRISEEMILVKKRGKYGYLNKQGALVLKNNYDEAFYFCNNRAAVKKDGNFFFINKGGIQISKNYDRVYDFFENIAVVEKNNRYNLIDTNGLELTKWFRFYLLEDKTHQYWSLNDYIQNPKINSSAKFFKDGKAIVEILKIKNEWRTKPTDEPYTIINQFGKIISDNFEDVEPFAPNVYKVKKRNNVDENYSFSWHFLSFIKGLKLSEPFYKIENLGENNLAVVAKKTNNESYEKYGYVNNLGEIVIECSFYKAENFKNGYALVKKGTFVSNKSTIIDTLGKPILMWFDEIDSEDFPLLTVKNNGKTALINIFSKKQSTWFDYLKKCNHKQNTYLAQNNNLYFFIDSLGNSISTNFEKINDYATHMVTKRALIFFKYKQAVVDIDTRGQFFSGLAKVRKNNKWGFIDESFNIAIPCKYDDAKEFNEETAEVILNGKSCLINKKGEIIK